MSVLHLALAADLKPARLGLSPSAKSVLLQLANLADSDTGQCSVRQQDIADRTGHTLGTVGQAVAALRMAGCISVFPVQTPEQGCLPNRYLVHLDVLMTAAASQKARVQP